jgi:hypothetical protein
MKIRWAGHVACTEKIRNSYILIGNSEEESPLRRPRHRFEDNPEVYLKETGCGPDSPGSGYTQQADTCEHGNKPSGCIRYMLKGKWVWDVGRGGTVNLVRELTRAGFCYFIWGCWTKESKTDYNDRWRSHALVMFKLRISALSGITWTKDCSVRKGLVVHLRMPSEVLNNFMRWNETLLSNLWLNFSLKHH